MLKARAQARLTPSWRHPTPVSSLRALPFENLASKWAVLLKRGNKPYPETDELVAFIRKHLQFNGDKEVFSKDGILGTGKLEDVFGLGEKVLPYSFPSYCTDRGSYFRYYPHCTHELLMLLQPLKSPAWGTRLWHQLSGKGGRDIVSQYAWDKITEVTAHLSFSCLEQGYEI